MPANDGGSEIVCCPQGANRVDQIHS
jgi:hypothetical protein